MKVQYFIKTQLDESSVLVQNTGLKLEGLDEKAAVDRRVFSHLFRMKQGNIIFGHNFGNPAIVWVPCFAALLLLRTVRLHTLYYVDSSCSNACVRNFHLFSYLFFLSFLVHGGSCCSVVVSDSFWWFGSFGGLVGYI